MPKEELVKIAGLSVLLVRSSRKTLAVQIRADGTVIARAPLRMPKDRILCFLSENGVMDSHAAGENAGTGKHAAAGTYPSGCGTGKGAS